MSKNDSIAIDTLKAVIHKFAILAGMKARGLPQDQIQVAQIAAELVQDMQKFKEYMDEDAAPYLNLPDNVVPIGKSTTH